MKFLFTSWEGGGNVTPTLEAARKMIRRGHEVRFMSEDCNRAEAEAAGAAFVAWTRAPNRKDRTRESQLFRDWDAASPQEGLLSVVRDLWCGPALVYAQDVTEELQRAPADLVVTNESLFGVMAACERLSQKFVVFSPNISLAPLPGVPPMGPGLAPARNAEERAMHAQIAAAVEAMFDSGLPALNAARAVLGLAPLVHVMDQLKAAELELLGTSRAFDFPAAALPSRVRYVGPLLADPGWARAWTSPWPAVDARPLVVVAFSTTFQNHAGVLQNVIDALAILPVRTLVTLGGSIVRGELHGADNCVILDSAPHSALIPQAALTVTHGGHGTVARCLASGVPMLVIPHGRDQNDNAVRVVERGAGLSLAPDASVEALRAACERLLNDPDFRTAASRFADKVRVEIETSTLAEDLENAARTLRAS